MCHRELTKRTMRHTVRKIPGNVPMLKETTEAENRLITEGELLSYTEETAVVRYLPV